MKKAIIFVLIVALILIAVPSAMFAAKPAGNLASAVKVPWNLSAAVMPAPPYGSFDIPGSDTASKLIVNQPNGNTEVTITGAMNGLNPNTTYTVFLANGYTPYVFTGWNVTGSYTINATINGAGSYTEYLVLDQSGTGITGTSLALAGNASPWTIESGTVNGTTVEFLAHYNAVPSLHAQFNATIAGDGSMTGTWHDVAPGTRTGNWSTTVGAAGKTHTGDDWYTGLFTATVQPFTFTTDEFGAGSWHVNLKDTDFSELGSYTLSVWINEAGLTMLVSNNFQVLAE